MDVDQMRMEMDRKKLSFDEEKLELDRSKFKWEVSKHSSDKSELHATRTHDRVRKDIDDLFSSVISFSIPAVRSPGIINAGAFAATLALLTQIKQDETSVVISTIYAISIFIAGVAFSAIAVSTTYISQFFYSKSLSSIEFTWEHPYFKYTGKAHTIYQIIGAGFHIATLVVTILSFIMFIAGALLLISTLVYKTIGHHPSLLEVIGTAWSLIRPQ